MWTLALPGGARVAVVAAQWCDAFGVVTGGRVQLELRDGEPGPVLGRDAGFWLCGTGVRALRNPGRSTARVVATIAASAANKPVTASPPSWWVWLVWPDARPATTPLSFLLFMSFLLIRYLASGVG